MFFSIALFVLSVLSQNTAQIPETFNPKTLISAARSNFTSLAKLNGLSPLEYKVVTEDGYILTLYRIPGRSQLPVLLIHGILDSVDTFVMRGESSLAVSLAHHGYDIWFANSRGNKYSRRHILLNPDKDASFWKFSFHEVGYYDLPAFIDKILDETKAPSLSAIAHSQGNTAFYVLGSTRPEYNKKINIMTALAPVCYFKTSILSISTLIALSPFIAKFLDAFNIHEFFGETSLITKILRIICPIPEAGYVLCILVLLFPITGYNVKEFEPQFLPTVLKYFPAGTSSRSFVHFLQVASNGIFAPFDNGPAANRYLYNLTNPPPYDLGKVSMPIAFLTAKNDFLSTIPNVIRLKNKLPNVVYHIVMPQPLFNHIDYVWGRSLHSYILPYVLEILQRYNGFR